jgi:hypothetical protein
MSRMNTLAALALVAALPPGMEGSGPPTGEAAPSTPETRRERREQREADKRGRAALLVPKAEAKRARKAAQRLRAQEKSRRQPPEAR